MDGLDRGMGMVCGMSNTNMGGLNEKNAKLTMPKRTTEHDGDVKCAEMDRLRCFSPTSPPDKFNKCALHVMVLCGVGGVLAPQFGI